MTIETTFFAGLPIARVEWSLSRAVSVTRLRDGTVIPTERGAPLWRASVTLGRGTAAEFAMIEAQLAWLTGAGRRLLAYDPRHHGPLADPGGTILGAASPTIHTLDSDTRRLRVQGLPGGYVLSAGDYIGWTYLEDPVRYAMHRLVDGAVASQAGLTPLFEVVPPIRSGTVAGAAVALIRPQVRAVIVDASYGSGRSVITEGTSFDIIQTLR